jgi:hypothetical protein
MMKNVYNIGAFQVNREDFILNILYSGNENTVPTGYFTEGPEGIVGFLYSGYLTLITSIRS